MPVHAKMVGLYGLTEDEVDFVKTKLPQKSCQIMNTDCMTDIIAVQEFAVIVRIDKVMFLFSDAESCSNFVNGLNRVIDLEERVQYEVTYGSTAETILCITMYHELGQ